MRRLWAAGVAMLVCLALGGVPALAQETAESEAPAGPMTIGFAGFGSDYWFLDDITRGAQQAADAAGVMLVVTDAGWGGLTQASQVEDLVKQGVDAIIVAAPWDPDPVLTAIEVADAAGIPVLTVDRGMDGATSRIGTDNVAGSRMAGEYLFEAMGGSGEVIEIQGDPSWAQGRTEGFGQALDAAPGITLVGQDTARDDPGMARVLSANLLGANPDVTGIFVHTDAMTPGVLQAVAEGGLTQEVVVVSFDGSPDMLPAVKDGTLAGTVAQRPDLMGQKAVEVAMRAAAGETVEAFIPVETTLVTQDNVDQFLTGGSAAEPAAWTGATVEILSDVGVIPLEAIPNLADHVAFVRLSVEPAISGGGPGNHPQSWASLDYVASGSLTATPETARVYWRADGSVQEVPAGMTAGERSGDTVLSWNGAAAWELENQGLEEYVVFSVLVADSYHPEVETELVPGIEWRTLDYIFPLGANAFDWFSAPIAVSYQRITWEPGAQLVLGPDEVPMLSFIWLESGQLKSGEVAVDEVSRTELVLTISTGWTYRQERPPDGTVYVLRNEGDAPAVGIAAVLSHPSDT